MNTKVVILLVFAVMAYPVFIMQSGDQVEYQKISSYLASLQGLDHETNGLLMRARLNIDKNYDNLAVQPAHIEKVQRLVTASKEVLGDKITDGNFERYYNSYLDELENKNAIIESFKTHNSVLRNSVIYLPLAAERLIQAAQQDQLEQEVEIIKDLRADVMSYGYSGDVSIKASALQKVSLVKTFESKFPPSHVETFLGFTKHADVILEEKDTTDDYLYRAVNSNASSHLNEAIEHLQKLSEEELESLELFRIVLMIYVALFMIFLGYVIHAMSKVYRM